MEEYVGLDVSKEETCYCIMDKDGTILKRGKTASDPEALFKMLKAHTECPARIVLETGSQSSWLGAGLADKALPISCVCARAANAAMRLHPNKTDDNDALMLADMARTGFYREVEIKSLEARRRRGQLKARHQLQSQRRDIDNAMRGLLTSFGVKLPKGAARLPERIREAVLDRADLARFITPLLEARAALVAAFAKLDHQVTEEARASQTCRRLMSVPGVGALTALTFAATIDDPGRFKGARSAGAYIGLTPRRYQSGEVDVSGRISKQGDSLLRAALFEAAHVLLTRVRKSLPLKSWGLRLKARKGHKTACVALARKLAVILLAMWRSGEAFRPGAAPVAAGM